MNEIVFQNVHKTYASGLFKKKVQALRGLDLTVRPGEVFGLIGPNGAGKSTTLRLLLELTRPDAGTILFRDAPIRQAQIQRHVGYLPENPYLYDHLTLSELLEFGGRVTGMTGVACNRRSLVLVDRLEMSEFLRRPLRTFSKGMRQRAGICYALLHDPSVVILDEPMSGLDPLGRRLLFDLVVELKSQGKTVFFCSHILSDVERLCDRIGLLVKGRLIKEYDKSLFCENPRLPVHLLVALVDQGQKQALEARGFEVIVEAGNSLLSLAPERLGEATELMSRLDIKILGTRSGRASLEQLFLECVNAPGGEQ